MKIIGKIQEGELGVRTTTLGEAGLVKYSNKKATSAIYWDTVDEAIYQLKQAIKYLEEEK